MSHDNKANPERPTPPPERPSPEAAKPSPNHVDGNRSRLASATEQGSKGIHDLVANPRAAVSAVADKTKAAVSDAAKAIGHAAAHPGETVKRAIEAQYGYAPGTADVMANDLKKGVNDVKKGAAVAAVSAITISTAAAGVANAQHATNSLRGAESTFRAPHAVVQPVPEQTKADGLADLGERTQRVADSLLKLRKPKDSEDA